MRQIEQRAVQAYRDQFLEEPALVASAPGRVNLIGEHTDYNGGFVLPCAIDRRVAMAVGYGDAQLYSADFQERRTLLRKREGSWADYPSGVVCAMKERGYDIPPFRGAFAGDVPLGSGLSSSAAIEAATALALDALLHFGIAKTDLAVLCQRAENAFVGVNSGIMDQYASLLCQAGTALLIDCRSLEAKPVPIDLERIDLTLLVCDTRVYRELGATGYNERRQACERAAHTLGVRELRDAHYQDLEKLSGEERKRARHVITENARVLEAVQALQRQDFGAFGRLMYASHRSLRDDYEVSTPELDAFVEIAVQSSALGARLTGAGFGGCAIALIRSEDAQVLALSVRHYFEVCGFTQPVFYSFQPEAGAEVAI
ncbi:MAG TPA: galactokinase [Ktedonobacteraceae bacterium]